MTERTPLPQEQGEQQNGDARPTLEELRQQLRDLDEQIRKHLKRGAQ